MDEEIAGSGRRDTGGLRWTHRVLQRLEVIVVLPLARIDASELPEHAEEVRLTAQREPQGERCRGAESSNAEVLAVQHGLGLHQLLVETVERQSRGEDRVLDVEEAVVERSEAPRLGVPDLRARIRRRDGEVHDLGHRHRPIAHDRELPLVPARVGDDVDRDGETDLPRHFEGAEVLVGRDALAVELEAFLVQRFEAEEHVVQPQAAPVLEDLAVAKQDVATGLEVVLLAYPKPFQLMADGQPVLRMYERDVVHQKDVGLGDARDIRSGGRRRDPPIATTIESPGAAERAVPGTAARQLGGGAGIEHADEVLVPTPGQIARGRKAVEILQQQRRRPLAIESDHAREGGEARVPDRLQQTWRDQLALAAHHAVESAARVFQHFPGDERDAVPAREEEAARPAAARLHREVDHFRHVGQVVDRKADGVGPERLHCVRVVPMREDLQIEEPHLVAGGADGGRHALEP